MDTRARTARSRAPWRSSASAGSLLIIRDAFLGLRRFDQFQQNLGIARNVLTGRLNWLVGEGILERVRYSERPSATSTS